MQAHPQVSLVFPILNDARHGYLERNLSELATLPQTEMICIDGGSDDDSHMLAERHGARYIVIERSNRAQRINRGIEAARGDWVVLVHPRSRLSATCINELLDHAPLGSWGAWTHSFDDRHPLLKFTSWYSNCVRGALKSIYYLDHCLFIHRSLLDSLGTPAVPEIPIFEDTELCLKLRRIRTGVRLRTRTRTSAIRFRTNGIVKQAAINQWSKLKYRLRHDLQRINRVYEAGLALNERE
jgi:glycosyltransferase involved in cell wall biosynthesis